jgi:hypothetical protein
MLMNPKVWGVVCDNASNNAAMMNRFASYDLKRLTGPDCRVHCMLHVLNLAAKVRAIYINLSLVMLT